MVPCHGRHDFRKPSLLLCPEGILAHAFLDGNKRVGFAAVHTFLFINGFDLDVTSKAAFQFVMRALEDGKFRFALLHEWISEHLVPLNG